MFYGAVDLFRHALPDSIDTLPNGCGLARFLLTRALRPGADPTAPVS